MCKTGKSKLNSKCLTENVTFLSGFWPIKWFLYLDVCPGICLKQQIRQGFVGSFENFCIEWTWLQFDKFFSSFKNDFVSSFLSWILKIFWTKKNYWFNYFNSSESLQTFLWTYEQISCHHFRFQFKSYHDFRFVSKLSQFWHQLCPQRIIDDPKKFQRRKLVKQLRISTLQTPRFYKVCNCLVINLDVDKTTCQGVIDYFLFIRDMYWNTVFISWNF